MITERPARFFFMLWLTLCAAAPAAAEDPFVIGYVARAADSFYARSRAYTGLSLRDRHRPVAGAELGLRDSRFVGRALGIRFELAQTHLDDDADPVDVVAGLIREHGIKVFLLDLPLADVIRLGAAHADARVLLFNIRHPHDDLRGPGCSAALFHSIPSHAMLQDALAQFLRKKNWPDVLVLAGQRDADRVLLDAFARSARKFQLNLVATRPFVLSNDPRERGKNNIPLLTRGGGYDVIYLADVQGEFGRYVPFNTQQPRPVIGGEGLTANAWHWTLERYGAPQLNQRFRRRVERNMGDMDYAAWAAVRSVTEAIARTKSTDVDVLRAFLRSGDFSLDTYKGAPGSYRPWDNQLRQGIVLNTHNAVIDIAPMDGFLHELNHLDTLGVDKRESVCKM